MSSVESSRAAGIPPVRTADGHRARVPIGAHLLVLLGGVAAFRGESAPCAAGATSSCSPWSSCHSHRTLPVRSPDVVVPSIADASALRRRKHRPAVLILVAIKDPHRIAERLTPNAEEMSQWPVLLGCLAGGFGIALKLYVPSSAGTTSSFQTVRAWLGLLAILLLVFETLFQFVILPGMSDRPSPETLKIWEGFLIAVVASYFGSRA